MRRFIILCHLLVLISLTGCSQVYYNTMEKFGVHKREILVDRVEEAKEAQEEGREEFVDALEAFSNLVNFDGGNLEKTYDKLNSKYEQSKSAAATISKRIDAIESVAKAMFKEWHLELEQYSNRNLRRESEKQLRDTETRYGQLIRVMRKTEARIDPVLEVMQDQVLFLKHNLNAKAIRSLKSEIPKINADVNSLVKSMQEAIKEADAFIGNMHN